MRRGGPRYLGFSVLLLSCGMHLGCEAFVLCCDLPRKQFCRMSAAIGMTGPDPSASLRIISSPSVNADLMAAEDSINASQKEIPHRMPKKYHHLTVCMVPPESSETVWEMITKCRIELKDPGLYRWPPHANLLYPFLDLRPTQPVNIQGDDPPEPLVSPDIVNGLIAACSQCKPFAIRLQQLGTFGCGKRGVLWFHPDSYRLKSGVEINGDDDFDPRNENVPPPLVALQSLLVEYFPSCNDQNLKSIDGFNPHMTVAHFVSHEGALAAQERIEAWWPTDLEFPVDRIYLLQRLGDSGQFLRVADITLGENATAIVHQKPIAFSHMPTIEDAWVLEERMKLKKRRNGKERGRKKYHKRL